MDERKKHETFRRMKNDTSLVVKWYEGKKTH
jgi:hypothetical protein